MPVNQPELQNHIWFTTAVATFRDKLPNFKIINVWGPNMSCLITNQVMFFWDGPSLVQPTVTRVWRSSSFRSMYISLYYYSSAKWNPSNTKSSSSPGGGKWARMQQTTHDGNGTLISFPRIPQHHRTSWRYAICRLSLCSGPSKDWQYCCLYWYQAACNTHLLRHTAWKPGCCVIHDGGCSQSPILTASLFFVTICSNSEQHLHSSCLGIIWQFSHMHLK